MGNEWVIPSLGVFLRLFIQDLVVMICLPELSAQFQLKKTYFNQMKKESEEIGKYRAPNENLVL